MFSINKFAQGKSPMKYGLIHCKKIHSLEWFRVLISYDIFEYFKIPRQLRLQPLWRRRKNWQFLCDYPGYDTPRWNIFATSTRRLGMIFDTQISHDSISNLWSVDEKLSFTHAFKILWRNSLSFNSRLRSHEVMKVSEFCNQHAIDFSKCTNNERKYNVDDKTSV